jgi:2-polyprenyl-3-methyl-5-hydroxy-6-metoxy-1,4-benzoquinol methylase
VVRSFRYCTCLECGAVHVEPFPTEAQVREWYQIEDYYQNDDRNVGYQDYFTQKEALQRTYRERNEFFGRHYTVAGADVLEVGCGPGFYPSTLEPHGFRSYLGLDLNPHAVAQFDPRYSAREGSVEDLDASEVFDLVVLFDVLEHVLTPHSFMSALRSHVRTGGHVLLTTPLTSSWLARMSGPRWVSYIVPQHVILYDQRSLRFLLDEHGLALVACRSDRQWITLSFLVDHVLSLVLPRKAARALSRPLEKVNWRVRVPNGMLLVVAEAVERVGAGK